VANIVNLLLTSKNGNVLKISPNDRSFVLFRCSNHYLNDKINQIWLGRHLDRQDVARALYQHLSSRALEAYPYNFQASRPITDYNMEAQLACVCSVARFMSVLDNDDQGWDIKAKELCDRYKNFVLFCGYKNFKTVTGFGPGDRRQAQQRSVLEAQYKWHTLYSEKGSDQSTLAEVKSI
jgi:hypothetical protein